MTYGDFSQPETEPGGACSPVRELCLYDFPDAASPNFQSQCQTGLCLSAFSGSTGKAIKPQHTSIQRELIS